MSSNLPRISNSGGGAYNAGLPRLANYIPNAYNPLSLEENARDVRTWIAPIQLQRIRQDILTWRNALIESENAWYPQRVKAQQMFYDTIVNGHVLACIRKRQSLTLMRAYRMVDENGKESEQLTAYFKKKWFRSFLKHTVNAQFYGYTPIQIGDIENGEPTKVNVIKRHNIYLGRNGNYPVVTTIPYNITGIPIDDPDFEIEGVKPSDWAIWIPTEDELGISECGQGLLYNIAYYAIFLRNLMGWNSDFLETYGQPYRVGKTSKSQTDPERDKLKEALAAMGSNGWAVIDPEDEIELVEAAMAGTGWKGYENLEQRCEKKVSKIVFGHSDVMESTPGKLGAGQGSGSKGNSAVQDAIAETQATDGAFVEDVVNDLLIPKLKNLGCRIPDGFRWEFSNDDELIEARQTEDANNLATAQVAQTFSSAGYELDEAYLTERIGAPVTKKEPVVPNILPTQEDKQFAKGVKNRLKLLYKAHG